MRHVLRIRHREGRREPKEEAWQKEVLANNSLVDCELRLGVEFGFRTRSWQTCRMLKQKQNQNAAARVPKNDYEIVLSLEHQEVLESWQREGETLGDVLGRVIDHWAQIQSQMDYARELVVSRGETPNEVNVRAEFLKLLEAPERFVM